MGSQFVDLNGDGHTDYLSATFDGSPHVAYGSAEGFGEPEHLLDADGERIVIAHIWNYKKKKHEVIGRAMGTDSPRSERCISALAFDWDADGDYDLLLGSYENGRLYRQMNEGSNAEPKFTGKNVEVMAGDQPFAIAAKMTAPRLVDWDGDGDLDLLTGSFGDSYGQKQPGGGVYLSLNDGSEGKPKFGELQTLIEPSQKGHTEPVRPDAGLYPDAVDYDGDGDLDLIVGGYSMWTPTGRELTDAEQARAKELEEHIEAASAKMNKLNAAILAKADKAAEGFERGEAEWMTEYKAIAKESAAERKEFSEALTELREELADLVPSPQRQTFVWLYERQ